jgi:hypothetical protein
MQVHGHLRPLLHRLHLCRPHRSARHHPQVTAPSLTRPHRLARVSPPPSHRKDLQRIAPLWLSKTAIMRSQVPPIPSCPPPLSATPNVVKVKTWPNAWGNSTLSKASAPPHPFHRFPDLIASRCVAHLTLPKAGLEWTAEMFAYLFAGAIARCAFAWGVPRRDSSSSCGAAHSPRHLAAAGVTRTCYRALALGCSAFSFQRPF